MERAKDIMLKCYFSANDRYADLVNGLAFQGEQIIEAQDMQEMDTQTGIWSIPQTLLGRTRQQKGRYRDLIRKTAMGVNFVVVGIENQEEMDYSMVLRNMAYDVNEYERQYSQIRKKVRKSSEKMTPGEYLYGFRKEDRFYPVVTFLLFYGEEWDGAVELHELIDFTDIPQKMRNLVQNYGKINLVEIRKLTKAQTSLFQTDLRLVFDIIRCSKDADGLAQLIYENKAYTQMKEDAYDVAAAYTKSYELMEIKEEYQKGGKVDMCEALTTLIERGKAEGMEQGIKALVEICKELQLPRREIIEKLQTKFEISEEKAQTYVLKYWN